MSHVTCQVLHVMYFLAPFLFSVLFGHNGGASWALVRYQRGLSRLVFPAIMYRAPSRDGLIIMDSPANNHFISPRSQGLVREGKRVGLVTEEDSIDITTQQEQEQEQEQE